MAVEIAKRVTLPASPDRVAEVLTDLPRWPEWFALYKGWVGDVPQRATVGARFTHKVRILGAPGEIQWTVTELDLPRRIKVRGKGTSRTGAEITFDITPHDDGSEVAFVARLSGLALKPFEGLVRPWIEVRVERTVTALQRELGSPQ